VNYIFAPYKWWNAMLSINVKNLNIYHDSYVGITKTQLIAKTWDPRIGPAVTRGEVHETRWITRDFIECFAFKFEGIGLIKGIRSPNHIGG
jgi:hypothetical protein